MSEFKSDEAVLILNCKLKSRIPVISLAELQKKYDPDLALLVVPSPGTVNTQLAVQTNWGYSEEN